MEEDIKDKYTSDSGIKKLCRLNMYKVLLVIYVYNNEVICFTVLFIFTYVFFDFCNLFCSYILFDIKNIFLLIIYVFDTVTALYTVAGENLDNIRKKLNYYYSSLPSSCVLDTAI